MTRIKEALRIILSDRLAAFGAVAVVCLTALAIFAPWIAPFNPARQDLGHRFAAPDAMYILGTDNLGRDALSRIIWGSRISLQVSMIAVALALCFGGSLGMAGGYYGRWVDDLIMRCTEVLLAFPPILLALAILTVLRPNILNLMIAIGLAGTPNFARVARASSLQIRELAYIEAARAAGASDGRILSKHMLPNAIGPLIVIASLMMGTAILAEATLSFLGLGVQPPTASWGSMLGEARSYLSNAPWLSVFPGIIVMITVLAFNLLGDGMRDMLDPRSARPRNRKGRWAWIHRPVAGRAFD